jgi:hypothetical protein
MSFSLFQALLFSVFFAYTAAFLVGPISSNLHFHGLCAWKGPIVESGNNERQPTTQAAVAAPTRRDLILQGLFVTAAGFAWKPLIAAAKEEKNIPMLTTDEFLIIVRDSARSIQRVEFDGPKGETVRVRLIDGTAFGISDVIESPIDPRSPLKVQAACREAKSKFWQLNAQRNCDGISYKNGIGISPQRFDSIQFFIVMFCSPL